MTNILRFLIATLTLLALTACGGGGGGGAGAPQTPTFTVTFTAGSNGAVTGTTSQSVAQGSNAVSVTAVPASGYHFVNWTEGSMVVGTTTALVINNVTTNHSYTANFAKTYTTATVSVKLTGTLPAGTTIAGADITITLPANVMPLISNGVVSTGVVSPSGTFAGGTQATPVYTAATGTAPAALKMVLASALPGGVTQAGEVATVVLQLANYTVPTVASFSVSSVSVTDAVLYNEINGMGASVVGVTLQ